MFNKSTLPPSHGRNRGSIPLGSANCFNGLAESCGLKCGNAPKYALECVSNFVHFRVVFVFNIPLNTALSRTDPFIETCVENARLHDLRRTGATHLTGEGLSIPRLIVSKVLNHISDTGGSSAVTAVYDRNAYLAQKRNALDAWATSLSRIVDGQPLSSNVVPFAN